MREQFLLVEMPFLLLKRTKECDMSDLLPRRHTLLLGRLENLCDICHTP